MMSGRIINQNGLAIEARPDRTHPAADALFMAFRLNVGGILCMMGQIQESGGLVARGRKAYKSEKRSKELRRLKKQEAKRLRRLQKGSGPPLEGEEPLPEGTAEAGETTEAGETGEAEGTPEGEDPDTAPDETT
jgi:hypothetical protein